MKSNSMSFACLKEVSPRGPGLFRTDVTFIRKTGLFHPDETPLVDLARQNSRTVSRTPWVRSLSLLGRFHEVPPSFHAKIFVVGTAGMRPLGFSIGSVVFS